MQFVNVIECIFMCLKKISIKTYYILDASVRSQIYNYLSFYVGREEKLEHNIYKKASLDPTFPSEDVISEFLTAKSIDLPDFIWIKPSPISFMVRFYVSTKLHIW